MRVIAGSAKGRTLKAPKGLETRPTTAKVKEAIFSVLADLVIDARLLDAYAGSGALAIEALSRGAQSAVLCEKNRQAAALIRDNVSRSGFAERCRICNLAAERLLAASDVGPFELVFLDPPYNRGQIALIEPLLLRPGVLSPEAVVVLETDGESPELLQGPEWELLKHSSYGDTAVYYYGLAAYPADKV